MMTTPLERAIARGLSSHGDLYSELDSLNDYAVHSREDALAICEALSRYPWKPAQAKKTKSPLRELLSLFQSVESRESPAFEVLSESGQSHLIRILEAELARGTKIDADTLLFLLKILARYESPAGSQKIVEMARLPFKPDAYMWHVILGSISEDHPYREFVLKELSNPLPTEFLAVAFLDCANTIAIAGNISRHPFDSTEGWKRLKSYLTDSEESHFSYARSAAAALPFISSPAQDNLLALAMKHESVEVQLEGAWAAGKLRRAAGLKMLERYCLDVNYSRIAREYLCELDREGLIPSQALDDSFLAQSEFASWLAHPNELGQPPNELHVVDSRMLAWPPEGEQKPFWLIRYRLRDKTGLEEDDIDCGLVGSMTWCFFSYRMHERPPEDAYAIHCYWEMTHHGLIEERTVENQDEYADILRQWKGPPLESPKVLRISELSAALGRPGAVAVLASAKNHSRDGWVVLDGPRSAWYPRDEQPDGPHGSGVDDNVILMIHLGRQLLGFHSEPDRKKYLAPPPPERTPAQIVSAYKKLMTEAAQAQPSRQKKLLGSWSILSRHYREYVKSLASLSGLSEEAAEIKVYGRFLNLAKGADLSIREEVYDVMSVLGEGFVDCVKALSANSRNAEIVALVEFFAPRWNHNLGNSRLGVAAFKAGRLDLAERFLVQVRTNNPEYHRANEMGLLAEIWHRLGKADKARALLMRCMQALAKDYRKSKYPSDRESLAETLQNHRAAFLRLYPNAAEDLVRLNLDDILP